MIAVHLHGRLRDLVDPALLPLRLDVRSPAEAYFALRSQLPGFETLIREGNWSYLVDDETPVTQDQVGLALPDGADLHVYPVAEGSGFIIDFFVGIFSFIGSLFFPSIKDYDFDQADERASYLFNGAVNTRAQGGPVPLVFGGPIKVGSYTISAGVTSARLTPPRKNLPSKVKGKAAEFENTLQTGATIRIVDLISEGEIEGLTDGARSVFLDGVPVQDAAGNEVVAVGSPAPGAADFSLPYGAIGTGYHAGGGAAAPGNSNLKGVKIDDRTGTGSQDPLDGIPAIEVERVIEQRVTRATPQVRTITNADVDTARVTLRFPALVHVNDGGDRVATRVSFAIDVQAGGESTYTTRLNQTLHDKNISPAEISYEIPLEGAAPWHIRVRRLTADSASDRTQNQTFWARLTEIRSIRQTYPHSAVVSIVAEAEEYTGNIQRREYLVKGLKVDVPSNYDPVRRTYTGIWNGRFKKAWTDNGAWCFYHLLVNRRFGLGGDIDQAYLDAVKWDLYTIAQFNDGVIRYAAGAPSGFRDGFEFVRGATEPRFRFSGVVQKAADAKKLLDNMLSNFHAAAYYSGGAVVAAQDSPADPEALLTNSNVEDGDFHYADVPWSDRVSVVAVSFNDPLDDYRLGIELVIDNDLVAKYGYKKRDVVAMFCTSRGQAHRFGRLLLFEQEHESDTLTCRTGMDQATLRPGAVVRQADRLVAAGRTGVRVAGYDRQARRLTLDDLTTLKNTGTSGWRINVMLEDGTVALRQVTSFQAAAGTVVIDQALDPPPAPGAVAVVEKASVAARLWRAISVREIEGDRLGYELALKAYHPDKYAAVENDVNVVTPDYRLDETERYRPLPAPGTVALTAGQVQEGYTVRDTLTISVTLARGESGLIDYELRGPYLAGAEAGAAWTPVGRVAARTYEVPGTFPAGTFRARARTVSRNLTAVGAWVESGTATLAGVSARPVTSQRLSYDTFVPAGAVDADGEFRLQSADGNTVHDTPAEILADATPRLLLAVTDADGVDRGKLFAALAAGDFLVLSHAAGWWLAWRLDSVRVQGATATIALSLPASFGAGGNVTPLAGQTVEVGISSAATGQDGRPGLPGAGRILTYDDVHSGSLTAAGQYKFSNSATFSGAGVITPAKVESARYLYVHQQDAAGTDQSHYYDEVVAGDIVVWYDDPDWWLEWRITATRKTGNVYRFALAFLESIDDDAANLADGNVELRFSRPPRGLDGVDGGEYEYVFCARGSADAVTGAANLPDPDWHFDLPALASNSGVVRGTNRFYDGIPKNLSGARPYVVRFKRRVQGFPAPNEDIGTVAWEQEKAFRYWANDGRPGIAGIRGLAGYVKRIALSKFEKTLAGVNADKDWHIPAADVSAAGWTANDVDFYFRTDDEAEQQLFNFLEAGALVTLYIDENNWGDYEFGGISLENDRYHLSGMTLIESAGDMATTKSMALRLTAANVVYRNLWSGTAVITTTNRKGYEPFRFNLPDDVDINDYDHIVITIYMVAHGAVEMLVESMPEIGQSLKPDALDASSTVLTGVQGGADTYYLSIFKATDGSYLSATVYGPPVRRFSFVRVFSIDAVKKSLDSGKQTIPSSPPPAAARLTLDDSGTVEIEEGDSRVFRFSIGKAVSANVTVTCTLSGVGAFGNDVSFHANTADISESVTIRAGDTTGRVTVHARDQDAADNAVLTVSTTSTLIAAGHRRDTVTIDPVAAGTVTPSPGQVSLDLRQSGTLTIEEGESKVFTYALSKAVTRTVSLTATLTGTGAGSSVSFSSSSSVTSQSKNIRAGQTTGTGITVYAREDNDSDDETVTLTIATTSTEVDDRSDTVQIRTDDDDTATTTWTLSPSSDQDIQEGASKLFTIELAKAVSASVSFTLTLSGAGAGSDVSFASGLSDVSESRSITRGSKTATVRVYARDQDATDAATLTVSTTSNLITGTKSRSLDIDVTAAALTLFYGVTIVPGTGNHGVTKLPWYGYKTTRGWPANSTPNSYGSISRYAGSASNLGYPILGIVWQGGTLVMTIGTNSANKLPPDTDDFFYSFTIHGIASFLRSAGGSRTSGNTWRAWQWSVGEKLTNKTGGQWQMAFRR